MVKDSFWFIPAAMAVSSVIIAIVMLIIDEEVSERGEMIWVVTRIGAQGVRSVLSVVANSTITVTGVVFSITIVALTLAASQLSPRLLRNYMKNTANQVVLGTFVSTYLFSMIIMVRINETKENYFVPYISFTLGVLLAVVSLVVLIYFIHHISMSIQADYIIGLVGNELNRALDRVSASKGKGQERKENSASEADSIIKYFPLQEIKGKKSGYIQVIDSEGLLDVAKECDGLIKLKHRPGDFIIPGNTIAEFYSRICMEEKSVEKVLDYFIMGSQRQWEQDVEFSANQLVEVALRALSPGINDTFSALACIDKLSVGVDSFMKKDSICPYFYDENGRLRLIIKNVTFAGFTDAAFNKIRQAAEGNIAVTIRMLERLSDLAKGASDEEQKTVLLKHGKMIKEAALRKDPQENDRNDIEERFDRFIKLCRS